jgi:hypothetical protein
LKDDPEFKEMVDAIQDEAIDFVEGKLYTLIDDENVAAILFYLKTKAKHRGYIEKTQTESTHKIEQGSRLIIEKTYDSEDKTE